MIYSSTKHCVEDLEKHGHLIRIKEEVDPNLEMAAIHLRVFEKGGPAILFENIKGCEFQAVSNLFGTLDRSKFIFRNSFSKVKQLIELKNDPVKAIKSPYKNFSLGLLALKSLPKKVTTGPILYSETTIDKLPLIKCWENDGGAFVTLPQVFSLDPENKSILKSNLGMYRVQLNGNDYENNKEIGLHYQIHRGIGVHQTKANRQGKPLKVSIFIGGSPAHTVAAVMPLPEGLSELTFGGALAGKRFRYINKDGHTLSADADFVITGEIFENETKPEGPFGDHLGYYSLTHDFPVLKVDKVYHRKDAIWPFTIVGRPPQEDTQFGALIHELTGSAIPEEIAGLYEVNAVDAAGVHPLLLAVGSERYTPYQKIKQPQELLTIANNILGFGQLSLAKYLFISNKEDNPNLSCNNIKDFFTHILERVNWERDLHFQTNTTIDTLDYSGTGINQGSKVVIAAVGEKKRTLNSNCKIENSELVMPGIIATSFNPYTSSENAEKEINNYSLQIANQDLNGIMMILLVDDARFVAEELNNFLWVTFTRSNPANDIYGVNSYTKNKHWGCKGPLIIDARIKPHHAPPLIKNRDIEARVDKLGEKGGSLHGII
ncbi:UbiD family decarboxylase [Vicingus serpentipes]|uniref:UbiD family decarboxylase n=1 Tax=Vicingus serpentipes TaxID=1926625 RepID=A0A5C6RPG4_9FLAO|nr:UbiD family decarboxylase [Vicingus serpentipes]TXB64221.1 UbiD family decarboxylase [Vicingus serpentipes]